MLQEQMQQGDTAIWLNHTGCPGVIPGIYSPGGGGVWPRLQPLTSARKKWQDTYACPKCDLRIVVTLVTESKNKER